MRPDRFQLLDEIDFVWEVDCADLKASLTPLQWDEMYQRLVEFKETTDTPMWKRARRGLDVVAGRQLLIMMPLQYKLSVRSTRSKTTRRRSLSCIESRPTE
jgi:hypothetical protein